MNVALYVDRPYFRRQFRQIKKQSGSKKSIDHLINKLQQRINTSIAMAESRRKLDYQLHFPEELPVSMKQEDIARTISESQVVIIAGETGSGKTTQIPKICLELGLGILGRIGHTQPRRIAARSVAQRIAEELSTEIGGVVGYQVRFHDHVRPATRIKLMTDGILLAEIQSDRDLLQYDTLIIDEAHERSLNIDFILGYLSQLIKRRPELKVIITSATIATEKFSKHFNKAPVIEVSGRSYPVDVLYRPLNSDDPDEQDLKIKEGILSAVDELTRRERGDILIFLSGEREIRDIAEALRKHHPPGTEILPLFSRLSVSEQNRIFQSHTKLRIVLATNVAETSLTVPGIKYVIDPGVARISRYSYRNKVQRLPIEKISQASADQRKGRCGRVSAGVCVRLYDEEDFNLREAFTEPEIQRTNLASVILNMKTLSLGEVDQFPFIDPPDQRYINDGYRLLFELSAVDDNRMLTRTGKEMARLSVDPRLARMVLQANSESCLKEILIIVCALTIQDPRERPLDAQQKADEAHKLFQDEGSDFISFVKIWDYYQEQKKHLSNNKLRKHCHDRFLAYRRIFEWQELLKQLEHQVKEMGMRPNETEAGSESIHRSLLSGLLGNVGFNAEQSEYQGSHGKKFMIFPGSGVFKKRPKWIMPATIVETSRLYARTVASIKPEWLEQVGKHLIKYSYSEPYWQVRSGHVAAKETLTLYGLTVINNRKVNYGSVNPTASREIFIRSALVQGDFKTRAKFFQRNMGIMKQVEKLEDKERRRDIQADEELLFDFYNERIPESVISQPAFEKWWRKQESKQSDLLDIKLEQLIRRDAVMAKEQAYPDVLMSQGMPLSLSYHFAPGESSDGVTLNIPLAILNQLQPNQFDWLVPGLLQEKIISLIKSLPKSLRRNFVPVPDYARACMSVLSHGNGLLFEQLSEQLKRMTGVEITVDAWQIDKLPLHLLMNYNVIDDKKKILKTGRDLLQLQQALQMEARDSFAQQVKPEETGELIEHQDIQTWDFGDLPVSMEIERNGFQLQAYPALVERDSRIFIANMDQQDEAEQATRHGLVCLFMRLHRKEVNYLKKNISNRSKLCILYAPLGKCEELINDIQYLAVCSALSLDENYIRTEVEFKKRDAAALQNLMTVTNEISVTITALLTHYQSVRKKIKGNLNPTWLKVITDIKSQLDYLLPKSFIQKTAYEQLKYFPRYLKAVELRMEKLEKNIQRETRLMNEVNEFWKPCMLYMENHPDESGNIEFIKFRWMLEEYRVSLFAQELKTAYPVSAKRLREQLAKI
ncbi:MAG: ATP-dependent RNA helicase HrpA [Gammaproteobacteria bacterium]|nr:ATP-dependent RNA helicase HrpA [Gammaproteobacteria bacterium]